MASIGYTVVRRPAPTLSGLSISPRNFRAATRGKATIHNSHAGSLISYRDDQPALASVRVYRYQGTRRCSAHSHKRCPKLVLAGKFTHADRAGTNAFRFSGRLNGRALPPSNYQLVITAQRAGRSSRAITARFRILAP
jgi:hypothetical protein